MKDIYSNLKSKLGVYAFETGLVVGIFISAYRYNNSIKRNRKYIVDAMEHATITVRKAE